MRGPYPVHVTTHLGRAAVFTDRSGEAHLLDEGRLARTVAEIAKAGSGVPHHGVAMPFGERTVISLAAPGEQLPDRLGLAGPDGRLTDEVGGCPQLHGEAAVARSRVLFACGDGYLLVTVGRRGLEGARIGLPGGLPAGTRTGTLRGQPGTGWVIGNLGSVGLVRVDVREGRATALRMSSRPVDFAAHPPSRSALVVAADGQVQQIDVASGQVRAGVPAVAPVSGSPGVPQPRIVAGGGQRAWVSDPGAGRVVELATNPLRVTRAFAVGGAPSLLAVAGGEAA